jgi:hypothetical protein
LQSAVTAASEKKFYENAEKHGLDGIEGKGR